jgi:molecular chaperone DnaJ
MNVNGRDRGDLLARVVVEVPTKLNSEQRQKLEEFAELCGDENTPLHKASSTARKISSANRDRED